MTFRSVIGPRGTLVRWALYAGLWAAVIGGYSHWRSARAEDAKTPAAGASDQAAPADLKQAEQKADAALAETEKQRAARAKAADAQPRFDIVKEVLDRPEHMWAVWIILAVSIVSVAAAIERALGIRRSKVVPRELLAGLKSIVMHKGGFDPRQAAALCRQYPSSAATIVEMILQKLGRPVAEVEQAAADASNREASKLYANVRWQTLAFNVAPMVGLAGTVYGMLLAFFNTANLPMHQNRMATLATGIYAALICTFAGLIVAIPAGILAHVFETRILGLFREVDELMLFLMPEIERFEGQPRNLDGPDKHAAAPTAAAEKPKSKQPAASNS